MKYLVIDTFKNTQQIMSEIEVRDIYYKIMEDIVYNWKDCSDKELVKKLEEEKDNVYVTNIEDVIKTIMEDDKWLKIKEVR